MAVTGIFTRQRKHTRQSGQLMLLFVIALLIIACFMHVQAGLISILMGRSGNDWLFSSYALMLMAGAYGMIFLGAMFRYLELREGGSAVARHYGAIPIKRQGASRQEKKLLTVIDEISIAAIEQPVPLWLLPREMGINAFVVGGERDYALIVTRGALETFSTQQLRAMVAHEIAHISHEDLPLNMRILIVLSGLLAINHIARLAIKSRFLPAIVTGYALNIFGLPGAFGASFIANAFNRQREFLADAKAVQFTRNPSGFAETLDVGCSSHHSTRLHGIYADEIHNFCFLPFTNKDLPSVFLSQPSIDERINRIDPYFKVRKSTAERITSRQENPGTVAESLGVDVVSQSCVMNTCNERLSEISEGLPIGKSGGLPDQLIFALQSERAPEAMLFALLLYRFEGSSALFLKAMALKGKQVQSILVSRFQTTLAEMLVSYDGEIISHVAALLKKSHSTDELHSLYRELLQISRLDGSHSLYEYLLLERMASALGMVVEHTHKDTRLSLQESVALILALVVGASGQKEERQEVRYATVLRVYGYSMANPELLDAKSLIDNVKNALSVLREQMPAVREAFVMHCAEIVLDDAHVTRIEQDLLVLLSSSLEVGTPHLH